MDAIIAIIIIIVIIIIVIIIIIIIIIYFESGIYMYVNNIGYKNKTN